MLKARDGLSQKQALERTFGGHCGVRNVPARAVAFESCQRREIPNGMPVTSAVTLTVALIRNEGNRVGQPTREELTVKVHEFTLILTAEPNEEESDRLYSIFDDGTLATIAGVPQIHFYREASSLEEAIGSALVNVRKAGFDVVRVEIEPKVVARDTGISSRTATAW